MVLRPVLFGIILLALLGALPAQAALFKPVTATFANGLQVVVVENRRAPVVLHMMWYRVGSADEVAAEAGIAHFLEHMMFKGTKENPAQDYSAEIAALGGVDNAFTSFDYTAYFARIHPERLSDVMRMEAARMTGLRLDYDDIEVERGVVQQERAERNESSAAARFMLDMNALFYGAHPYARPIIGTRATIDDYNKRAVDAFYLTHYAPNNAILLIVGDVAAADAIAEARTIYEELPSAMLAPRVRTGALPTSPMRLTRSAAEVKQAQLHWWWPAPSARQDPAASLALQVLVEVLNSPDSPLQQDLVYQKPLAAGVQLDYDADRLDSSSVTLSAVPRAGTSNAVLEQALQRSWQRALAAIDEAAVARAQQRLLDTATLARDSLHVPAYVFGMALTTGQSIADVENWPKNIAAVNTAAVRRAAASLRGTPLLAAQLLPAAENVKGKP